MPTNFKEDMWVQAAEIRPGSRTVVHHIIVFVAEAATSSSACSSAMRRASSQPLCQRAGAQNTRRLESGFPGSLHAERHRGERSFLCRIDLCQRAAEERNADAPDYEHEVCDPAGRPELSRESTFTFTEDSHIHSLMPHMHLRGKDFEYRVTFPTARRRCCCRCRSMTSRGRVTTC